MLIKEYHIPLPLTVEEYRIAQLYMIQKKSREESEGEGSAIEILENKPYTDGPNGSGQYTYKIYHIGRHLPNWFRSIAPKTALEVHEESWNAYPYTKTIFKVPFVEKFSLEVETYFVQDGGTEENKFKLSPSELRSRELDVIDMVNDSLSGNDYKEDEDPSLYISQKSGRGQLASDWISNPPDGVIMCAYKLIKVEFRYWGLQSKVERFIHDYGLRRVMLRAHRQAWAWQDEWVGLTIADIRRLERETQFILQKKLGRIPADAEYQEEEEVNDERDEELTIGDSPVPTDLISDPSSPAGQQLESSRKESDELPTDQAVSQSHLPSRLHDHPKSIKRISSLPHENFGDERSSSGSKDGGHKWTRSQFSWRSRPGERGSTRSVQTHRPSDNGVRRSSRSYGSFDSSNRNTSEASLKMKTSTLEVKRYMQSTKPYDSDEESMYSARPEWAFDQIAMLSDESDSEFFDAKERISDDEEDISPEEGENETLPELPNSPRISTTTCEASSVRPVQNKTLDLSSHLSASSLPAGDESGIAGQRLPHPWSSGKATSLDYSGDELGTPSVQDLPVPGSKTVDILFLVFHGGSALDARKDQIGKAIDFQTLSDNMRSIIELHFHSALGRVALRMVPCVNVCSDALQMLSEVNPIPVTKQAFSEGLFPPPSQDDTMNSRRFSNVNQSFKETLQGCPCHVPVGAVPLVATEFYGYTESLAVVTKTANTVYRRFLRSDEGKNFSGQVCLLADCMGSVIAYDIISSTPSSPSNSSPRNSPSPKASRRRITSHTPEEPEPGTQLTSLQTNPLTMVDRLFGSNSSLSSSTTSINVTDEGSGFVFEVSHFFAFGSPLGLVLGSRRSKSRREAVEPPPRPNCTAFYNLFYGIDPMASRIEPLLDSRFSELSPISVPSYRLYPSGIAKANSLKETVVQHPHLLGPQTLSAPQSLWKGAGLNRKKAISSECLLSLSPTPKDSTMKEIKPFSVWWSQRKTDANRIDYTLECPQWAECFNLLPQAAFSHVIHSRYWEAKELVTFMLRQVLRHDTISLKQTTNGKELIPFLPQQSVSSWNRRRTAIKIKRLGPNHRVSDVIAAESGPMPSFTAKFQYGPLAMTSLSKEDVEVYLLLQSPKPKWELFGSGVTDGHGKLVVTLPEEKRLPPGVYPVKFLVKGDHTTATCNLFVVPPHTEAVVFSVDGALASNFSLSARDMKMKHGAVEAAKCWQEKGYLLIYITGRPLIQKEHILTFLGAHRFPLGLVACADSLSPDSQTFKTMYLARLIKEAKVIIHVAYGSQRHLAGYKDLGLQPDQIYIHGSRRTPKSLRNQISASCQYLTDGFASHLETLESRCASYDARKLMGDICFVLPGIPRNEDAKRKGSRKGYQRTDSTVSSDSLTSKKTPQLSRNSWSKDPSTPSLDRSKLILKAETTV